MFHRIIAITTARFADDFLMKGRYKPEQLAAKIVELSSLP
jgi:hypothetical protein